MTRWLRVDGSRVEDGKYVVEIRFKRFWYLYPQFWTWVLRHRMWRALPDETSPETPLT